MHHILNVSMYGGRCISPLSTYASVLRINCIEYHRVPFSSNHVIFCLKTNFQDSTKVRAHVIFRVIMSQRSQWHALTGFMRETKHTFNLSGD